MSMPLQSALEHREGESHHHHSHAAASHHDHGHHLLTVEHLSVGFDMYDASAPYFSASKVYHRVIDDLTISVHRGEIIAVVGASGSGKTLLADSLLGLYQPNAQVSGQIWFDGVRVDADDLSALRGHGISLVPQRVSYLDPSMKIEHQIVGDCGRGRAGREKRIRRLQRLDQLYKTYGLTSDVSSLYPHELSGGMARRVLLMCALIDDPQLIVADEPTPGLDLELAVRAVDDLRRFADNGSGVLLITHDLELALRVADRIAVFKDGSIVEETSAVNFKDPQNLVHPFSKLLWHALPSNGFSATGMKEQ